MMILLSGTTDSNPPREPFTRPRIWYQIIFKMIQPQDSQMTPEQAFAIVEANWTRSYNDIKRNGVVMP